MGRREFSQAVKVEIARRAAIEINGWLAGRRCENCGCDTKGSFEFHHLREDGLEVDKSRKLTAADGALWCIPCHDDHTRRFSTPAVAKAKRREAKHLGVKKKATMARRPKEPRSSAKLDSIRALGPTTLGKAAR